MKSNADNKEYICGKCGKIIKWYNPEDIEKNPSPAQY